MKIYIAVIADRHCDPDPVPFETAEAAIEFARDQILEMAGDRRITEEAVSDTLFYARYGHEGDCVWVVERELRGD